ncbi:MAG: hypothetical protein A2Z07_05245 [Armatimonadetes bacterium RBG_16_67_12]|nr:MAG: hypothetical protein A2Z07_05245 [Armatimonadetes bacterium RBG_16_67_12]
MHEGDQSILGDEHEHEHKHAHAHGQDHAHPHAEDRRQNTSRLIAGAIVAAAVVLFVVWRFL